MICHGPQGKTETNSARNSYSENTCFPAWVPTRCFRPGAVSVRGRDAPSAAGDPRLDAILHRIAVQRGEEAVEFGAGAGGQPTGLDRQSDLFRLQLQPSASLSSFAITLSTQSSKSSLLPLSHNLVSWLDN